MNMMAKMKNKSLVTLDELKSIKIELRELDYGWVAKLEAQILADKKNEYDKNNFSSTKIYNVFNGVVSNNAWRVFILSEAKKMRNKLTKELEKATA